MTYIYLLAGEDLELAEHDLKGFLESQGLTGNIERHGKLAVTEEEPYRGQLRRLALTHEVSELVEEVETVDEISYRPEGSYAVRTVEVEEGAEKGLEAEAGGVISTEENTVDLESADENLRLYAMEDSYILGRLLTDIDRGLFRERKNQERPYSSPVSMDPVTARVLVNISGVEPGDSLLDPFCGTGGILLEAGLCGIQVFGMDIQEKMVEGARENLEEYGILNHDIRQGDIAELEDVFGRNFDAIVTDLPYGKASKLENAPVEQFLEKAPDIADRVVFMSDKPDVGGLEPEHEIYVHKSMTRYIYIIQS